MLVPINWLKDFVDIDLEPNEIKTLLVSCGFEVEQIIDLSQNIKNVFTAKIVRVETHPASEKLIICYVSCINNQLFKIVTNDINQHTGNIVAVALDGATLFNGKRIFKGEIKGVISDGMLCGLDELGLDLNDYPTASKNGVLILENNTKIGVNINEIIGRNEVILDISITANRTDANSILGIARELAAITGKKLSYMTPNNNLNNSKVLSIINNAPDLCNRYIGCVVNNITISESPVFIKQRLKSVGIRPINNIVDLTNYALISVGQPMHVFDYDKISGNQIVVRRGREDESIVALDGEKYLLTNNMLIICDNNKPMAIAGIMGGQYSSVSKSTKSVVFESATFARENVRATAKCLNLHSDSSARFEKGVDLFSQELGLQFIVDLITKYGWGELEGAIDSLSIGIESKKISFTSKQIENILGVKIEDVDIMNILSNLGFTVFTIFDHFDCIVPKWREDIFGINDIAEEIIRIIGYDVYNFSDRNRGYTLLLGTKGKRQKQIDKIKDTLIGSGCSEIVNYSFISPKSIDILNLPLDLTNKPIKILNPLSEDYSIMRQSLIYSMLKIISKNYQRGNKEVSLFEIANIYNTKEDIITALPKETASLCISSIGTDFYKFKNILENLFYINRIDVSYKPSEISYLHPFRSAKIFEVSTGKPIGFLGEIKTNISEKFDIPSKVYVAELDLEYLLSIGLDYSGFAHISKYQASDRDIAIIVPLDTFASDILLEIEKCTTEIFLKAHIFDVFTGAQIGLNEKSVAINLRFQSMTHTLTDSEINIEIENIIKSLQSKFGAKLR